MLGTLVRFRVKNHGSIRDEATLSFVADGAKDQANSLLAFPERDISVGRVAAIYGANASGKSTVLDAFALLRAAVLFSQRLWAPERPLPVRPFILAAAPAETTELGVTVIIDSVRYDYGVALGPDAVEEERLAVWPHHRRQIWFERSRARGIFKFGDSLDGDNEAIQKLVRPNSLFLSAAAQNNHAQLRPLYRWFQNTVSRPATMPMRSRLGADLEASPEIAEGLVAYRSQILRLLQVADTGIVNLKVEEIPTQQPLEGSGLRRRFNLQLKHRGASDTWLEFADQSTGTRSMFDLALNLAPLLHHGGVALVDEIERSLHPILALEVVKLFQDPERNQSKAQLVFTTHDVSLLGNIGGRPLLRRDQVWFTEKQNDGSTTLYPLTDFKPRENENFARGYLQGRYGAVPYLGRLTLGDDEAK